MAGTKTRNTLNAWAIRYTNKKKKTSETFVFPQMCDWKPDKPYHAGKNLSLSYKEVAF